jgi:cobalt/nickel transport system permease protein
MHIPDGFIDAPTSLAAGAVAVTGIGVCVRRSAAVLEDRQVPLVGLVSAFVFAAQMVNFPVASGTSGHLLGGVLAAVLVGPALGALCLCVVLLVQSLLFADGGLSALGLNVVDMALVGVLGGYAMYAGLVRLLPRRASSVVVACGVAAGFSVVLSALAFTAEYAIGGTGGGSVTAVGGAMVGVHVLIGVGEGIITASTIGAVLAARPDLVHGARHLLPAGPVRVEAASAGTR